MSIAKPYDITERLRTPEEMAEYLFACIETAGEDRGFIRKVVEDVVTAAQKLAGDAPKQVAEGTPMSKPNLPPPSFYQKHEDVCGTEVGPPTPFWNQAAVEEAVRQALAAQASVPDLIEALKEMLSGWRYIRETHGDLYGVGWDRAEDKASAALARTPVADTRASFNLEDCNKEVYERGTYVGLFDIPKHVANELCAGISSATGARVDWHYFGGRVRVLALPSTAVHILKTACDERSAIIKLIDDLQDRAKEAKRYDDFDELGLLRLLVWKASAKET